MDDKVKQPVQFAGEPVEQPANVSQVVIPAEPAQEKQSGALTEEQIRKIVQSEKDKLATQLRETFAAELRQSATAKAEAPAQPPAANEVKVSTPPPATAARAGTNPQNDLVNDLQLDVESEYGIAIDKTDPEAQSIVRTDVVAYMRSYRAALKAKATRLNLISQPMPPQARMPMAGSGGGNVSPIHNINDPSILLSMGLNGK